MVSAVGATLRHRDGSLLDTRVHLSLLLEAMQQQSFPVTTVPSPGTGKLHKLLWWLQDQGSMHLLQDAEPGWFKIHASPPRSR